MEEPMGDRGIILPTTAQRLKEQAVAWRLWESFSPEQKKTVTKVINDYKAEPKRLSKWSPSDYSIRR